jgi:hypothetical protein
VDVTLTSRQAFEAMRTFLEQFNEREPPDRRQTLDQLLDWTTVDSDGVTSDPAQWSDWERAVASVLATGIT